MRLKVQVPSGTPVDEPVAKVVAEAENGLFCLLPRHVDFVAALVPSILYYTAPDGVERLLAVDEGTLVKCGDEVLVATFDAVQGDDAPALQAALDRMIEGRDDHARRARAALARIEAAAIRRLAALEGGHRA